MNDNFTDQFQDSEDFENEEETENNDDTSGETNQKSGVKFICPVCGEIKRDDVIFLCNTCDTTELIYKDGIYMCPSCLKPGENFQCMNCDSKEVKMIKE